MNKFTVAGCAIIVIVAWFLGLAGYNAIVAPILMLKGFSNQATAAITYMTYLVVTGIVLIVVGYVIEMLNFIKEK